MRHPSISQYTSSPVSSRTRRTPRLGRRMVRSASAGRADRAAAMSRAQPQSMKSAPDMSRTSRAGLFATASLSCSSRTGAVTRSSSPRMTTVVASRPALTSIATRPGRGRARGPVTRGARRDSTATGTGRDNARKGWKRNKATSRGTPTEQHLKALAGCCQEASPAVTQELRGQHRPCAGRRILGGMTVAHKYASPVPLREPVDARLGGRHQRLRSCGYAMDRPRRCRQCP